MKSNIVRLYAAQDYAAAAADCGKRESAVTRNRFLKKSDITIAGSANKRFGIEMRGFSVQLRSGRWFLRELHGFSA